MGLMRWLGEASDCSSSSTQMTHAPESCFPSGQSPARAKSEPQELQEAPVIIDQPHLRSPPAPMLTAEVLALGFKTDAAAGIKPTRRGNHDFCLLSLATISIVGV